ncbi:hypothetical protein J3Q64DRAFT_1862171 [Phycomyces blakesleeanus]|uniref:Uncharacterized protein n=2 Tax=Phycomyces blakesleeanus TaxID=4837 RepID=A0A167MB57_PHYB8|nr:hypothetical protein PHYBLDRAFT_65608 [Phycomyces blakesleeanus NRRL 1555(-)]OAD72344.1 hypothetical protein PHYBLDRAFT_65608 [Phycomyces blakesleeanus NRRL 1555(-)]|eukprot:XP_018290384.1 hypothetical protein PHYBLDRAFT_65608 [Phycomyces blakesleeanus NRRL 1555(-)]
MDNHKEKETDSSFHPEPLSFSFKPNPTRRLGTSLGSQSSYERSASSLETKPSVDSMESVETARRSMKILHRPILPSNTNGTNLPSLLPILSKRQDPPLRNSSCFPPQNKTLDMLKDFSQNHSAVNVQEQKKGATSIPPSKIKNGHEIHIQGVQYPDKPSQNPVKSSHGNEQPSMSPIILPKKATKYIKPDERIIQTLPNPELDFPNPKKAAPFQKNTKTVYPIEQQYTRAGTKVASVDNFNTEIDSLAGLCKQILAQKETAITESNQQIQVLEKKIQWQSEQIQEYITKSTKLEDFFNKSFRQSDQTKICSFENLSEKYDIFFSTLQGLESFIKTEKSQKESGTESKESETAVSLVDQKSIKVIKKSK